MIIYRKVNKKEEGFQDVSDGLPVDADNPDLTESSYFGTIPAAASISIAKKRQGVEATSGDNINTDGDGVPQVALLEVPESAIPADDIEVELRNQAGTEGFQNPSERIVGAATIKTFGPCPPGFNDGGSVCTKPGFPIQIVPKTLQCPSDRDDIAGLCYPKCPSTHPNRKPGAPMFCTAPAAAASPAQAAAPAPAAAPASAPGGGSNQQNINASQALSIGQQALNPTGTAVGLAVGAAVGAAGIAAGLPTTGNRSADAALGAVQGRVAGELQAKLEEKIQEKVQAKAAKLKNKVLKPVQKAGKIAARGAKKVMKKVGQKLASRVGKATIVKAMKKVAEKLAKKMAAKMAAVSARNAAVTASGAATFGVGAVVGLILSAISAAAFAIEIAITSVLEGEEGVCPPGMQAATDKFPGWLKELIGFIPAVGELFMAIFPYLCFSEAKCNDDEDLDAGLCYPKCEPGYDGVGPVCWTKNVGVGVGRIPDIGPCRPGLRDDGLSCWLDTYGRGAGYPWKFGDGLNLDAASNRCHNDNREYGCEKYGEIMYPRCRPGYRSVECCLCEPHGGPRIEQNLFQRQSCNDGGDLIAALCYKPCPLVGGNPYTIDRKYPVYIKTKVTKNQDAVQKKLDDLSNEISNRMSKASEIKNERDRNNAMNEVTNSTKPRMDALQKELQEAIQKDINSVDPNAPYVRNPEGPRDVDEPPVKWLNDGKPETRADKEPPFFIMSNQKSPLNPGGFNMMISNPEYNKWFNHPKDLEKYNRFIKKYPIPNPRTPESDIPVIVEKVTIDPRKRLRRIPGLPYQCMGERGIAYGRGVGRPAIAMKPKIKEPPPPPLPAPTWSSYFADDYATTPCKVDYSTKEMLQSMCQFYYRSSIVTAEETAEGTLSFEYISKVTKVIASSEQSCDLICDITSVTIDTASGKTTKSTTTQNNDRRFYFAKILKPCTFVPTAATNINNTARDVKNNELGPVDVNFTPTIDRCKDIPIQLKQCTNEKNINDMVKLYTSGGNLRVKQVTGAVNEGSNTCVLSLMESTYNSADNTESAPVKKIVNFTFQQTVTGDACLYKLDKFTPGYPTKVVPDLSKPINIEQPLPRESSLEGCQTKCNDPAILRKLVEAYNTNMKSTARITLVKKAFTASPLRCDIEADVYNFKTKQTETQSIRFDMAKGTGGSCEFTVSRVGSAGSGTFIQKSTPPLSTQLDTTDNLINQSNSVVKSASDSLSGLKNKINQFVGQTNSTFEKSLASVGQTLTLEGCNKKCSDPDVLQEIVSYYNESNYPRTRTNVTKKTIEKVLKAATSSRTTCDITFEEKQEQYNDFYTDVPKTTVTQKTQRFNMKKTDGCKFVVDTQEVIEGFQNTKGLPGMSKKSFANSQSPLLTPPYNGRGCELDCTKVESLNSMKELYDSQNIQGFANYGRYPTLREAFQDEEEVVYAEGEGEGEATYGEGEGGEISAEESAQSSSEKKNLKTVNRAFKSAPDTCEYEVTYDKTTTDEYGNVGEENDVTGYFSVVYSKDQNGCSFHAASVSEQTEPIIPSIPSNRVSIINYSY